LAKSLGSLLPRLERDLKETPTPIALPLVHPFPAPMSPRVAKTIIELGTASDSVVLDPMAGSGMVPLAALALGRECRALDIDPLALLTIRVQCGSYSLKDLSRIGLRVQERATQLAKQPAALDQRFKRDFDPPTRKFVNRWFPARSRRGLLSLWMAIAEARPAHLRDPLKIAFSRVIIAKSAGASRAIDLPHTRPHRLFGKRVPNPLVMFPRRLKELIERLGKRQPIPNDAKLDLRSGDVRRIPYADGSVDLVLTSSPYANAIDYMRAHKFSLVWMGYSVTELARIRAQMIGVEHGQQKPRREMAWLESKLPVVRKQWRRRVAIFRRFFYEMESVVQELHRVLRPGGACVLVLGKSIVSRHVIDTPACIATIAKRCGFNHVGTLFRDLNPHRRSLPFPRPRARGKSLGKRMHQEAIVVLERPKAARAQDSHRNGQAAAVGRP